MTDKQLLKDLNKTKNTLIRLSDIACEKGAIAIARDLEQSAIAVYKAIHLLEEKDET